MIEDKIKQQKDLTKLEKCEKDWLMDFNLDKCVDLSITKRKILIQNYKIHGTELQTVDQAKYLEKKTLQ